MLLLNAVILARSCESVKCSGNSSTFCCSQHMNICESKQCPWCNLWNLSALGTLGPKIWNAYLVLYINIHQQRSWIVQRLNDVRSILDWLPFHLRKHSLADVFACRWEQQHDGRHDSELIMWFVFWYSPLVLERSLQPAFLQACLNNLLSLHVGFRKIPRETMRCLFKTTVECKWIASCNGPASSIIQFCDAKGWWTTRSVTVNSCTVHVMMEFKKFRNTNINKFSSAFHVYVYVCLCYINQKCTITSLTPCNGPKTKLRKAIVLVTWKLAETWFRQAWLQTMGAVWDMNSIAFSRPSNQSCCGEHQITKAKHLLDRSKVSARQFLRLYANSTASTEPKVGKNGSMAFCQPSSQFLTLFHFQFPPFMALHHAASDQLPNSCCFKMNLAP